MASFCISITLLDYFCLSTGLQILEGIKAGTGGFRSRDNDTLLAIESVVQSTGVQQKEEEKACMSLSESHTDNKIKKKKCEFTLLPLAWSSSRRLSELKDVHILDKGTV